MISISEGIRREDIKRMEEIIRSTGYFFDYEIQTALEIAEETITDGPEKSGYRWLKATDGENLVAFASYGKNPFSIHSWDLYWIVVHQNLRHMKLGSVLLKTIEENVKRSGGKIIWAETSGRPLYVSTEEFYKRNGYELKASLKDFYGPGDPKQVYSKIL